MCQDMNNTSTPALQTTESAYELALRLAAAHKRRAARKSAAEFAIGMATFGFLPLYQWWKEGPVPVTVNGKVIQPRTKRERV